MNWLFLLFFIIPICFAGCPTDLKCDKSFKKCYKFVIEETEYFDAEENCQNFGGHLTSVKNIFENQLVLETAKSMFDGFSNFWVGGNFFMRNAWSWTDNSPWNYVNWFPGEPLMNQSVAVFINSGLWSSSSSSTRFPYICSLPYSSQMSTTLAIPTIQPTCKPIALCDDGWTHFQGFCYKVYPYNKKWVDAEQYCQENKAHLTSIHSEEENSFVNEIAARGVVESTNGQTWIGLHKVSGQWYWIDNTKVDYFNWAQNQPDNSGGNQNCVQIFPDGTDLADFPPKSWDDACCPYPLVNFICKKVANK